MVNSKVNTSVEKTEEYSDFLKKAINVDFNIKSEFPNFNVLVIHSNFKNDIFNNMKLLSFRSWN